MGNYAKTIQSVSKIIEIKPHGRWNGIEYEDAYDCFEIPSVSQWASNLIDAASPYYQIWGGITKDVYFSIKSINTHRNQDVPIGFQANMYRKDKEFKKIYRATINDAISGVLKVPAHIDKMKCVYWEVDFAKLDVKETLKNLVEAILKAIADNATKEEGR